MTVSRSPELPAKGPRISVVNHGTGNHDVAADTDHSAAIKTVAYATLIAPGVSRNAESSLQQRIAAAKNHGNACTIIFSNITKLVFNVLHLSLNYPR